ncbi:uncharacterized protein LOC135198251 [Macrobrachium nipponense]|uniref:uncharacterized protein LOC135198251 n=1 Tax=Macrobrachium nipponense TaxID=159736 RepID=UPI0030C87B77
MVPVILFKVLIDLVAEMHLQNAHLGIGKMTSMLRRLVWHHSLTKVIRDLRRTYKECQMCKVSREVVIPPTLCISTSTPFELVAMDLISLPTSSTGYVGCLMIVDHYSKWVTAPKWDKHLPRAFLSYNHPLHSELGCTPAEKILKTAAMC